MGMILQKLINHGKLPVNRMKLIFLGNGEAGKTSLLRALRGERFCEVLDRTNYMECLHVEQKQLDNWEEYEDISQVARSVNIARRNQIFASNTAINQSENEASVVVAARNLATVSENSAPLAPPSSNTGTIIENTRSLDLQNDVFSTENSLLPAELPDSEEIIKLLDELNTFTLEDDSFALSVFDFAGQDKYASLQQLFVTSNAVYVVVFNIKKMFLNKGEKLNKEEFQVVLGWLTTIHLRAPDAKVVLVASQADGDLFDKNRLALAKQLPDFFQQIAKKILGVFDLDRLGSFKDKIPISFLKQIVHVDDNNEAIFVTSSKSGLGISKLKKVINETVRCTILHSEHKPMGWIQLHDELAKKIQRKELRLVYSVQAMFDELIGNNRKFGIRSVKELRAALEYFHNIGVVLYYPDNDELRQYVFPDPQMLVTVVSSIFQKERPDSEFQHKNRFISGCWTKPLLEETLLNTRVEKDCIPLLLSVLKEFDLYCEPAFENGVDSFLGGDIIIPCLLSNFRCGHDLPDAYCRSSIEFTTVGLILTFQGNTLPRGLFHQLAIRFASRSPRAYIPKLHLYDAIVSLGGSRQLIMKEELVHGVISLRLFLNAENIRLDFLHAWTTVNATIKAVLAEHWSNRTNKSRYKLSVQCHGKDFEEYVPHGIPTILEFDSEYPENITFCDHHSHSGNLELENLRKFWFKDNSPESQTTDLSRVELKKMIMLSYSWGEYDSRLETYPDQVRVRNLKVALEKRGLNVWFDDEDMRGDMIDTMRNVIMNCAAVVACVSNSYHIKHRNAYDEFIFPCEVKRDRVIGVKLTPDADMLGGAYGFKKGKNELYYDVSGTDQGRVESQLDNLASALKIFIP
ncbi:Carrier protein, mitochondrial [Nowakowskiella sp. JEL0407]|nr:Carrier protein, mitochondrial [Nowakowskiella sp. JEL0407]